MPRFALPALALTVTLVLSGCAGDDRPVADATDRPTPSGTTASPTRSATPSPSATATPTPAGTTFNVTYAGGQVSGDTGRVQAALNDTVNIIVTSDVADEIHLHGYDVSVDVAPGTAATLTFQASIPGIFEVELEELGTQLLSLQVG